MMRSGARRLWINTWRWWPTWCHSSPPTLRDSTTLMSTTSCRRVRKRPSASEARRQRLNALDVQHYLFLYNVGVEDLLNYLFKQLSSIRHSCRALLSHVFCPLFVINYYWYCWPPILSSAPFTRIYRFFTASRSHRLSLAGSTHTINKRTMRFDGICMQY